MGAMSAASTELFAVVDFESDRLVDPNALEVGAIVIDRDLNELGSFETVIRPQTADWRQNMRTPDDYVERMHQKSGLIADIEAGKGVSLAEADRAVSDFLLSFTDQRMLLVGNSITFDRMLAQDRMPILYDTLHYRSIDVTSLRMFWEMIVGRKIEVSTPISGHRSLSDIRGSVDQLRQYQAEALAGELAQKQIKALLANGTISPSDLQHLHLV